MKIDVSLDLDQVLDALNRTNREIGGSSHGIKEFGPTGMHDFYCAQCDCTDPALALLGTIAEAASCTRGESGEWLPPA